MSDSQLYGIEIDLRLSKNPKIYYMYDRPDLDQEVRAFFMDNGLRIVGAGVDGSEAGQPHTYQGGRSRIRHHEVRC